MRDTGNSNIETGYLQPASLVSTALGENIMPSTKSVRIALVTCTNLIEARNIANRIVRKRLAACATIILGPIQSVYRWKGKVETSREQLLLIKTVEKQLPALEAEVKRLHSYEVPEILVLPAVYGSADYLNWLSENSQ